MRGLRAELELKQKPEVLEKGERRNTVDLILLSGSWRVRLSSTDSCPRLRLISLIRTEPATPPVCSPFEEFQFRF